MKNRGFIGSVVLIIVAIVLLKVWFHFDVFKWLNTPEIKNFLLKVWDIIVIIWENYIKESFHSLVALIKDLSNSH